MIKVDRNKNSQPLTRGVTNQPFMLKKMEIRHIIEFLNIFTIFDTII